MSLTVTQRPSTTISGETSKWNAVNNPILYKMVRKDFTIASISNSSGFAQLVISGNVASSFENGDSVYFQTDAGVYQSTGLVTTSSYSAPNTIVTTNVAYISSSTGFVNNDTLRPSYGVEISVYDSANNLLNSEPFLYTPNSKGVLSIDIASILRANLSPDLPTLGSLVTIDDTNVYKKFYIKYTEVWTGSANSATNDSSNQFFAVLGGMQIPSAYGGNMALYVSFDDGDPKGLFLTKFTDLTMWRGYPFLVSAIVGEGVTGNSYIHADGYDSTPASLSGKVATFDLNELVTVQTMDDFGIKVYRDDSPDKQIIHTKQVYLVDACENPVMLMGRNSLGGTMQWLFEVSQEYSFDYGDNIKAARKVLKTDDLTLNEWESLQDFFTLGQVYRNNIVEFTSSTIKTSSRIGNQVYVVETDGTKIGVIVIPTQNQTDTRFKRHSFTIEIEYPEVFAF